MDYFDKTVHKYWKISDALENAKSSLALDDDGALTYIRNKLNDYHNATAKHWKENWNRLTKQLNEKPRQSNPPSMSVNNYINAQASTNTINASLISNVRNSNSNSPSKRKQRSDEQAQTSNKRQFQLDDPFNDIEAEAAEDANETADEEPDNVVDLLGPVMVQGKDVSVPLNNWIKKSKHVPKVEDQDLLRYLIVDITPTTSSAVQKLLSKDTLLILGKHETASELTTERPSVKSFVNSVTRECRTFSKLKQSLLSSSNQASEEETTARQILKIYSKQRVKNLHLLSHENQTEQGFIIVYVAPIFKCLLEEEENLHFTWGESMLESHAENRDKGKQDDDRRSSGTKIDLKIDIMDEESNQIISNFCLLEVSGPPQVKCHNHFKRDKKRIAKGLKTFLNSIYTKNPSTFEAISKIVLYGVQIYNRQFFVYSLRLIKPKLYLFSLESHFAYPVSGLELVNMGDFVQSLFQMKNAIITSLKDVLAYITANTLSSGHTIKPNQIIADSSLTPPRKH